VLSVELIGIIMLQSSVKWKRVANAHHSLSVSPVGEHRSLLQTKEISCVVNGDGVFKNLLCTTGTADFNSLELLENKKHSSRPLVLRSNGNVAPFFT
jgi:hypothetical protein